MLKKIKQINFLMATSGSYLITIFRCLHLMSKIISATRIDAIDCVADTFSLTSNSNGMTIPFCHCNMLLEITCQRLMEIPIFSNNISFGIIYRSISMGSQSIANVPQHAFGDLKVRKIVLSFNKIEDRVNSSAFSGLAGILEELQMSACRIKSLPSGLLRNMEMLMSLHLWGNQIERLPSHFFKDCKNLRELLLWGNHIKVIDETSFSGLWKLQKLDLDKNNISVLRKEAFRHMAELEVVYLSDNKIHTISNNTFEFAKKLKVLNLSGNRIQLICEKAFEGLTNLISLSLDANNISFIPADCLNSSNKLVILGMKSNKLEALWPRTLNSQKSLYRLDLGNNRLTTLPESLLRHCHYIRHISLDNNQLGTIQRCTMPRIESLDQRMPLHKKMQLVSQQLALSHEANSGKRTSITPASSNNEDINTESNTNELMNLGTVSLYFKLSVYGNPLDCSDCQLLWLTAATSKSNGVHETADKHHPNEVLRMKIWGTCSYNSTLKYSMRSLGGLQLKHALQTKCNMGSMKGDCI